MVKQLLLLALGTTPLCLCAQDIFTIRSGGIMTLRPGAVLSVAGGVKLSDGSQLQNNGSITVLQNGSAGAANWTDNTKTGYDHGTGDLIFFSTQAQTINSLNNFGRLIIENNNLELASDLRLNNLQLQTGKVNTHDFKLIVFSDQTTAIQAGSQNPNFTKSWINGNIRRYFTGSADHYDFPIGSTSQSNMVALYNSQTAPLSGVSYLDCSFGAKQGDDLGLIVTEDGQPYTSVNPAGVWHILPDAAAPSGSFDLRVALGGFNGLADNRFAILQRPEGSTNASAWKVPSGSSLPQINTSGRTVSAGYAQRNNITSFGQFGIGMTDVPLPVKLASFDAKRVSADLVKLDWVTAQEQNSKGFDVERRLDNAASFAWVGFVASSAVGGNSTLPISYDLSDANTWRGVSYYRLKQVDLDGTSSYSIVKAVYGGSGDQQSVTIYPNPGHGQFSIRFNSGSDKTYTAILTDQLGRTIRQITITGNTPASISALSPGLYFVRIPDIFGKGISFTEKVLIVP